ncbi:ribbon-helix-helix domain-containing protein [Candidatus Woesearchaeota archaeon]|nr:ribbon-helix-helix domain-containing protein [Candidatus Woesearchaeota archaeon]
MATEQVLFKADKAFLKEVDAAVKEGNYQSRAEFIRESLRKNLDEHRLKEAAARIAHLRGAAKKRTSEEEFEKGREAAFEALSRRLR